jgi:hypothetical protein
MFAGNVDFKILFFIQRMITEPVISPIGDFSDWIASSHEPGNSQERRGKASRFQNVKSVPTRGTVFMSPIIREDCPCPKTTCKRHTLCDECEAVQIRKGGLPYCRRPKISLWGRIRKLFRSGK